MILFCLPYAGGSEVIYYKWKRYLNSSIQLEPIELKGRGKRFNEDFYENLEDAVEDIFENIKDKIVENEYAIYGHSMGSLLAYELYYKICNENVNIPKHIFFSGYKAPCISREKKQIYLLSDEEFIKEVIELGGTPQEVADNEELLQLYTPILRNGFKILEKYLYKEKKDKIKYDISVLIGKQYANALFNERKITLIRIKRNKAKLQFPKEFRQLIFKKRRLIETVNSQLTEQLNISKILAISLLGIIARLKTKILAHNLCYFINIIQGNVESRRKIKELIFG